MKPMISPNGKEGADSPSPPVLHLVRLPGEFGPILHCLGPLTVATREALRRELTLLETLNHPVLTLNLAGCVSLDVDGILTVLESSRRQRDRGRRLVVVAGKGAVARLLRVMGMDWVLPVFPTEYEAALALRDGWPSLPGPETWTQAQAETVVRWQVIQEALGEEQRDEVLRLLTSMTALCERSEEIRQERQAFGAIGLTPQEEASVPRCRFCPLFDALGGAAGGYRLPEPAGSDHRRGERRRYHRGGSPGAGGHRDALEDTTAGGGTALTGRGFAGVTWVTDLRGEGEYTECVNGNNPQGES